MLIKTNLHLHTSDDPHDKVEYTTHEAINAAAEKGFGAIAITCHNTCAWSSAYSDYAKNKGITLIRGIEANIGVNKEEKGRHVVLLGVDKNAEEIRTFAELEDYKKHHPEMLILAPHPFFDTRISLNEYTEPYIHLFDAIEHAWFYSKRINRNLPAIDLAKKHNKPLLATSDTHFLNYLDDHYTVVDAADTSETAILQAIKQHKITIHTRPHKLFREMIFPQAKFTLKTLLWRKGLFK